MAKKNRTKNFAFKHLFCCHFTKYFFLTCCCIVMQLLIREQRWWRLGGWSNVCYYCIITQSNPIKRSDQYMNPFEVGLPKWPCIFVKLLLSNAFMYAKYVQYRKLLPIVIWWCILRAFKYLFFFVLIFWPITMHYILCSHPFWSSSHVYQ